MISSPSHKRGQDGSLAALNLDYTSFLYIIVLRPVQVRCPCSSSLLHRARLSLLDWKMLFTRMMNSGSFLGPPDKRFTWGPETVNICNPSKPSPALGPLNHHNLPTYPRITPSAETPTTKKMFTLEIKFTASSLSYSIL